MKIKLVLFTIFLIAITFLIISNTLKHDINYYFPKKTDSNIENKITQALPTSFREKTFSTSTIMESATIERIIIPDCKDCYADIILQMDGLSDEQIIEVNKRLTFEIFKDSDIRINKNRIINKDISVHNLKTEIKYIKNKIITFKSGFEIDGYGLHPYRKLDSTESIIDFHKTNDIYFANLFAENYSQNKEIEQKILNHFYPNGKDILSNMIEEDTIKVDSSCFENYSFPDSFVSSIDTANKDVIFSIDYTYADGGPCSDSLMIAIPISDILKQLPGLIPVSSIIFRL
jgi:hypothetical protein